MHKAERLSKLDLWCAVYDNAIGWQRNDLLRIEAVADRKHKLQSIPSNVESETTIRTFVRTRFRPNFMIVTDNEFIDTPTPAGPTRT